MSVAVVLSGCGVFDGSEIHESSAACVALARAKKTPVFFAPDKDHYHNVNHLNGESSEGSDRNVLVEAGRIARGKISPLQELHASDFEAVVFPGGFGAAKNLSTFGVSSEPTVDDEVARVVREFRAASKPIAMCCIAPVIAALIIAKEDGEKVKVTLGKKGDGWPYATAIDSVVAMGAEVEEAGVDEVCVDKDNKLVTTPAFMYEGQFHEIFDGVNQMIEEMLKLIV